MAKDIVTLYQQRLKKGGGKPSFFGLVLLFVLWFVLVLKVWKKISTSSMSFIT